MASINKPVKSINKPNIFFIPEAGNLPESQLPMKVPEIPSTVIESNLVQSNVWWTKSPVNPTKEFKAIISKEDPTAVFMSRDA